MLSAAAGIKRLVAGVFVGGVLMLGFAGIAGAQSNPSGPSCPSGPSSPGCTTTVPMVTTTTLATTTTRIGGSTLPKTGDDLWIPLTAGGAAMGIALAARQIARRSVG